MADVCENNRRFVIHVFTVSAFEIDETHENRAFPDRGLTKQHYIITKYWLQYWFENKKLWMIFG